jgi:hypothetical protein
MDYPKENSASLYDYSDKSVSHAGYAAIAYAVISLFTGFLSWIQFLLYHRPAPAGLLDHEFATQQWLQHTPLLTAIAVGFSVFIAVLSGAFAFGIFRRSRAAIIAMIIFVVVLQLWTWFIARSLAGSLVSIVVVAFLLRGARRMFQDHDDREMEMKKA